MSEKLIRLKPPHPSAELNVGGRFFLPHLDGFVYIEDSEDNRLHIDAACRVGGYSRTAYPKFPSPIWAAINQLIDALDGSERQEVLDALECIAQGLVADDGAPAELPHPAA